MAKRVKQGGPDCKLGSTYGAKIWISERTGQSGQRLGKGQQVRALIAKVQQSTNPNSAAYQVDALALLEAFRHAGLPDKHIRKAGIPLNIERAAKSGHAEICPEALGRVVRLAYAHCEF